MKKLLALILAVAMVVGLVACGGSSGGGKSESAAGGSDTQAAAEDKTLTVAASCDAGELNPHTYSSPMWVQSLVYEGMTRFVNGEVVPGIAESWEISDDGLTYTFHLDKDNVFSDGTPVNAEIVKKNFDEVLAVKENHDWMETYQVLESVEIVDEYTVQFNLNAPFSGLLQELALARPVRVGAEAMFPDSGNTADAGIKEPVGSGPWIQIEHVASQYTVFERNDNYHGTLPEYKYLKVLVIPDINTAANSLKAGEIDMIYDIDSQMTGDIYNELEASGFTATLSDAVTTNMILVNTASGATQDPAVRLALEYGINKESISKNIYGGLQPVADYLMNPKTPYCDDPNLTVYSYDPEKAAQILEEAGWKLEDGKSVRSKDGQDLVLRFLYEGDNESVKTMGQAIQAEYAKIGVQIDMVAQDSTNYGTAQKEGAFELLQAETWGDPFDPHSYMSSFRVTTHGDYAAQLGLDNKQEIDDKITEALNSTDEALVEANYQYVLETLTDQCVYIPVSYTTKAIIVNPEVVDQVSYNTTLDVLYETFTLK